MEQNLKTNKRPTLFFKKVNENRMQRFYKLSEHITKVPNKNFDIKIEYEYYLKRVKEQYKHLLPSSIEYVCVSDAHTHIERLVFWAMPLNDECTEIGSMGGLQIDGKHTFMIHGGNSRDVHPDEVYLRRLASANGFNFGME